MNWTLEYNKDNHMITRCRTIEIMMPKKKENQTNKEPKVFRLVSILFIYRKHIHEQILG